MKQKATFEIPMQSANGLLKIVVNGTIDTNDDYSFSISSAQLNTGNSHVLSLTSYYDRNVSARLELEREVENTFDLQEECDCIKERELSDNTFY